jgi:hypothetical protein
MPYCKISGDTVLNVVECDAEFAAANGLEWVDQDLSVGFVLIDGVWRNMPLPQKVMEVGATAMERARFLELEYINEPDVWDAMTQAQKDEILAIKAYCDNIEAQEGYPFDLVWPDRTLVDGEL